MVLLKFPAWKGVICFRKKGMFGSWYIGPFQVISRAGKVAYRLELPEELSQIHSTFHVLQLRKCVLDEDPVFSMDDIQFDECLNYLGKPIAILERKMKVLCNK